MNREQKWALGVGAAIAGLGLAGMLPGVTQQTAKNGQNKKSLDAGRGEIAGVIPTNTAFNVARTGLGALGIWASTNEQASRVFLRGLAGVYAVFGVMGLMPQKNARTCFGLMPLDGGNVPLHLASAAAALAVTDLPTVMPAIQPAIDASMDKVSGIAHTLSDAMGFGQGEGDVSTPGAATPTNLA